jgi:hypothetical protein
MNVETKVVQKQTVRLKLNWADLTKMALEKAVGIGNWTVVCTNVIACEANTSYAKSIELTQSGEVTVYLMLEAPAIS